jgi:hypothetical protein
MSLTVERDWLDVTSPHKGPTNLYLVRVTTYGVTHPIKIGVAKNIARRMPGLRAMGIECPHLLGHFPMGSAEEAKRIEAAALRTFPKCDDYKTREVLDVALPEILAFLEPLIETKFIPAVAERR